MQAIQQERQQLLAVLLLVARKLRREARQRALESPRRHAADAGLRADRVRLSSDVRQSLLTPVVINGPDWVGQVRVHNFGGTEVGQPDSQTEAQHGTVALET